MAVGTAYSEKLLFKMMKKRILEKIENEESEHSAKEQLYQILKKDNKITQQDEEFDYTISDYTQWQKYYHTLTSVNLGLILPVDGLGAALAKFTFRALAKGEIKYKAKTSSHEICITGISIFVHDVFNFEGEADLSYWYCEPNHIGFEVTGEDKEHNIRNSDFHAFQRKYDCGNNFLVLSEPKSIVNFQEVCYTKP